MGELFIAAVLKYGGVVLLFLFGFIPIKEAGTNIWKWIFRAIGKALFKPLTDELSGMRKSINNIDERIDKQEKRLELSDVEDARRRCRVDVGARVKRLDECGILAQVRHDAQLNLAVVGSKEHLSLLGHEGTANLASVLASHGYVLQVRV